MRDVSNTGAVENKPYKVGLGCVTFGREIDREASFEIMHKAFEYGISFFDTAASYGSGASETIIGEWLTSHRGIKKITIGTKILPPFDLDNIQYAVDASLERLQIRTIDVLYLHRWDLSLESKTTLIALDNLIKQKKIHALGASNFSAGQLREINRLQTEAGLSSFQFVQNNHNLAVSEIDDELRNFCSENNIALISYSPLGAGFLTGKYQDEIEAGSRFHIIPGHRGIYFNQHAQQRLAKLLSVAARTGYTPAHLALAWAFHQPGIDRVLIGARHQKHLEQAINALAFNDPVIFAELEAG